MTDFTRFFYCFLPGQENGRPFRLDKCYDDGDQDHPGERGQDGEGQSHCREQHRVGQSLVEQASGARKVEEREEKCESVHVN